MHPFRETRTHLLGALCILLAGHDVVAEAQPNRKGSARHYFNRRDLEVCGLQVRIDADPNTKLFNKLIWSGREDLRIVPPNAFDRCTRTERCLPRGTKGGRPKRGVEKLVNAEEVALLEQPLAVTENSSDLGGILLFGVFVGPKRYKAKNRFQRRGCRIYGMQAHVGEVEGARGRVRGTRRQEVSAEKGGCTKQKRRDSQVLQQRPPAQTRISMGVKRHSIVCVTVRTLRLPQLR